MAMTASMTRSRRADGLHLPNPNPKIANTHHHRLLANATLNPSPRKRPPPDRDLESDVPKRARFTTGIAVEIPARSSLYARFPREPAADAKPAAAPPPHPTPAPAQRPNNKPPTSHRAAPHSTDAAKSAAAAAQQQQALTKHQEKVANGLKHELSRLQPDAADTKAPQGRKLRSQEAIRFKSELSAYFPEYDEVIGNDPKETHLLNIDTPIIITSGGAPPAPGRGTTHNPNPVDPASYPVRSYGDALYTDVFDAQRIDFSFLNTNKPSSSSSSTSTSTSTATSSSSDSDAADPLPNSLFAPAHKKAERLERSIRNSEKGRAQHERDQIIRLLDGLQGPDWLRVMGVSGLTESRRRQFEPARVHFVRGCEAILEKFRRWAAEEKRRRVEAAEGRRRNAKEEEEEESESEVEEVEEVEEEDGEEEKEVEEEVGDSEEDEQDSEEDEEDPDLEGEPPDDSDVDAKIARQLREEASLAAAAEKKTKTRKQPALKSKPPTTTTTTTRRGRRRSSSSTAPLPPPPLLPPPEETAPPREFTSFFAKRYQREAALSKSRRRGRTVLAWGHPVPEPPATEFVLPSELQDEEVLRSRARRKRRDKRVRN